MMLLALLLAASGEAPFEPSAERFADAALCRAHLQSIVTAAAGYDAVRGPYDLAEDDVRIHLIRTEENGHRIWEHRCLGASLSARTWQHAMAAAEDDFTIESVARNAEWLKKDAPQQ